LVFAVLGPHIVGGLLVPIAAGFITIIASAMIAATIAGRLAGIAAAALVATCPLMIVYARSFHFAMPATAVATVALLSLVRSCEFRRVGWVSTFGICVGLLPLARTMTIAFIPGLLIGMVLVVAAGGRSDLRRRLAMVCWAGILALLVAASWLAFNGQYVFAYLFSFGYGSRAGEFGPAGSALGLSAWQYTLRTLVNSIYLPHALILMGAVVAAIPVLIIVRRRLGWAHFIRCITTSKALPLLVFVAEALAALTSSQNKGSAFNAPVVPAMIVLAVYALNNLRSRTGERVRNFGYCVVSVTALLPLLSLDHALARPWTTSIPGLGSVYITDGRGTIQQYEANGGFNHDVVQPVDVHEGAAWMALNSVTAARLPERQSRIAFGFRHFLFNVNSVQLQFLIAGKASPGFAQVEPFVTGDTAQGYETWLRTGDAAHSCALLTLQGQGNEFDPPVTAATMVTAAEAARFVPVSRWNTPDQRMITLWQRTGSADCPG
jgi:hypothetical protein